MLVFLSILKWSFRLEAYLHPSTHRLEAEIRHFWFSTLRNSSIVLILFMIIFIFITHYGLGYLFKKRSVKGDHPQLLLWTGLISTFIAFTLSTAAQDVSSNKDSKQKATGILQAAKEATDMGEESTRQILVSAMINLHNNETVKFKELQKDINNPIHLIPESGDLFSIVSSSDPVTQDPLNEFMYSQDPSYWSRYDPTSSDTLSNLKELEKVILKYDAFSKMLETKIASLSNYRIYYFEYTIDMNSKIQEYYDNVISKKTLKDYVIKVNSSGYYHYEGDFGPYIVSRRFGEYDNQHFRINEIGTFNSWTKE